jgi:DNA-binding transcriptional ArsR family regulator
MSPGGGRSSLRRASRRRCALPVPGTEWRSSTLYVPAARDTDLELGGRGLVLYPCVGWTGRVMFSDSPDGARCLFYPAITPLPLVDVSGGGNPIAELLGRTRAAVLQAAIELHTTGDLARELGISAASVSAHTKTLRAAGLLTSERAGKAVFHSASPLGHRLLAWRLPLRRELRLEPSCAAPPARPPPGSALRTPARHGRAATAQRTADQSHSLTRQCCRCYADHPQGFGACEEDGRLGSRTSNVVPTLWGGAPGPRL